MDKEIGRIKKTDTADIVVKVDDFGGNIGVTIREFIKTDNYSGFTKQGTRIPKSEWENFVKIIKQVNFDE